MKRGIRGTFFLLNVPPRPVRLGVKAHFSDAEAMTAVAREHGASVIEVHLRAHDLHLDRPRVLSTFEAYRDEFAFVVHQPERVDAGDGSLFLNPSAPDERRRAQSEAALRDAAGLSRELGAEALILHPGGVEVPGETPAGSLEALRETLDAIRGIVPLYLENMPWFYHFGNGRVGSPTLGRFPESLIAVGDLVDGFCLDVSHAYLGTPDRSLLEEIAVALGDDVRHVHASGARRISPHSERGEGTRFAESDLMLQEVGDALRHVHPNAAVVPEIRGGEKNGGLAFGEALKQIKTILPP